MGFSSENYGLMLRPDLMDFSSENIRGGSRFERGYTLFCPVDSYAEKNINEGFFNLEEPETEMVFFFKVLQ